MATTATTQTIADAIFEFIGRAGGARPADVAERLGIEPFAASVWMKAQAAHGFLHRDASGVFCTSCPWPRPAATVTGGSR